MGRKFASCALHIAHHIGRAGVGGKGDEILIMNEQAQRFQAHIRLRPAMYLGKVELKGFVELLLQILSGTISKTQASQITFNFHDKNKGRLTIGNIRKEMIDNWAVFHDEDPTLPLFMEPLVLNSLSQYFHMIFYDKKRKEILAQRFEKGELAEGKIEDKPLACHSIVIDFQLDEEIWGDNFAWDENYITHRFREFAYLHKEARFTLNYLHAHEPCHITYHFNNGLKDRLDIEKFNGLGGAYFETAFDKQMNGFSLEMAFAFREYTVDKSFLESYVNDHYTHENGTHVDGLLKGLTYGVMKYFQKHQLTETYKISEKGIRESLIAILHIRMTAPNFSGCVRNKLANPEIIQPIADYVAGLLFEKMEADEVATEKLIRKFEM